MELNYETTCIPHRLLDSISEKYYTNFKPLFLAKSAYFTIFHISPLEVKVSILRPTYLIDKIHSPMYPPFKRVTSEPNLMPTQTRA